MSSATYYAGGTVTYYTAAGQPAFNSVVTVSAPVWEKLLPVPNQKVVFHQRFMQTAASYVPLAYDTPYPADATYGVPTGTTYYLVSEENFNEERGGMMSWDRVYAAVPTSYTEPEEYAYTFPAFAGFNSLGPTYGVTSITTSGSFYAVYSSATFSVGDTLFLNVRYTRTPYVNVAQAGFVVALGGVSTSYVLLGDVFAAGSTGAFTSVTGSIGQGRAGRDAPKAIVVASNVQHDYALSSISALNTNLPIIDAFVAITGNGTETDVISQFTIPNTSQYLSMIDNNTEIVAASSVRRRFLGNIYVRMTRYVTAQ